MGNPVHLSDSPVSVPDSAPELGRHTEEVMPELGFDWDQSVRLNEGTRQALRQKFI